jgi:Na+/H+ antiporter NhaC
MGAIGANTHPWDYSLHIASLVAPIVALVPAVFLRFSLPVLFALKISGGLLVYRFFGIFPSVASFISGLRTSALRPWPWALKEKPSAVR